MAAEDYMNATTYDDGYRSYVPTCSKAGIGGFIKSITRPFKGVAKGLSKAVKGCCKRCS